MREFVERILLFAIAGLSVIVAAMHIFGLLEWVHDLIPTITLLLLGMVALYVATENGPRLKIIEAAVQRGVEVIELTDPADLLNYYRSRIARAKKTVDDLTWGEYIGTSSDKEERALNLYVEEIARVTARDGSIRVREVMTFPNLKRLEKAEAFLQKDLPRYYLRYYDVAAGSIPPLMQFFVIDSEEVILGFYEFPEKERYLAVKHPQIVSLFQDYYEKIWSDALKLKEPNYDGTLALQAIRHQLTSAG